MQMWIAPAIFGIIGAFLFVRGLWVILRKPLSGGFGALAGGLFMALGAVSALVGMNFLTYQRLSHETPVAEVTLNATGPSAYSATIKLPDGKTSEYAILGDEWQIDARVLKWKPWANVVGLDASYRLERLAGRYHDINAERTAPRTVHQLSENPGLDLWSLAREYGKTAPVVDGLYGSATYVPMADKATYYVTLSQSGLLARPANDEARNAVASWK
jgi:hypothetical protein